MTTTKFDLIGATVEFDGDLISNTPVPADWLNKIDCDLRADAVAANKMCTLVVMIPSSDPNMSYAALATMPASSVIKIVQDTMQTQLSPISPNVTVPQTGVYDCKTAAYMVLVYQMLSKQGAGEVPGWPLDALELRELLDRSDPFIGMIGQVVDAYSQQNGVNIPVSQISVLLPDDYKTIKFHRAEVPPNCAAGAVVVQGTRWGLIAAVGILVAGAVGATYAISQHRRHEKHSL
jgi:hypothetical protein